MFDLRATALRWEDIEGVHRMRVASRRLRSALRDFDDFIEGRGVPHRRLIDVAGALGEVRDQDVAIAALEKVRKKASGDVAEGIGLLIGERDALRARARGRGLSPSSRRRRSRSCVRSSCRGWRGLASAAFRRRRASERAAPGR
jgi:hypothetical protein